MTSAARARVQPFSRTDSAKLPTQLGNWAPKVPKGRFAEGPTCPIQQKEELYSSKGSKEPEHTARDLQ